MDLLSFLINGIFPELCPCCQKNFNRALSSICQMCQVKTRKNLLLQYQSVSELVENKIADRRVFYFSNLYYFAFYNDFEKAFLTQLKFHSSSDLEKIVFGCMRKFSEMFFQDGRLKYQAIIPAPSSRRLVRNISQFLSTVLNVPVINPFIKEGKRENKKMNQGSRYFEIEKNLKCGQIDPVYQKVLLVDDLWTTGATMNQMAKQLSTKGLPVSSMDVFVLFIRKKRTIIDHGPDGSL